jgi:hypothetical protein
MMIKGYEIATRTIILVVAALALVIGAALFVRSCDNRHSAGAQSRVERSQSNAASNSAADAINTVTTVGSNEAASEGLGRSNDKDIRSAPGASDRVNSGVDTAGRKALCKRAAYRNDPKCKGTSQ